MPKYRRDHNWSSGKRVLFGKSRHAPPAREDSCTHGLAQVIRLIFSPQKNIESTKLSKPSKLRNPKSSGTLN